MQVYYYIKDEVGEETLEDIRVDSLSIAATHSWERSHFELYMDDYINDFYYNHDGWESRWPLTFVFSFTDKLWYG